MKKTLRGRMLLACLLCMSAASMAASDEGQPANMYETVGVENVPDEILLISAGFRKPLRMPERFSAIGLWET